MKLQLIHTDNYLVAVDDSDIKEGDYCIDINSNQYFQCLRNQKDGIYEWKDGNSWVRLHKNCKKITHHLPLNNAPVLEGVELLPRLEIPKVFTVEDMENAYYNGWIDRGESDKKSYTKSRDIFKQSISQPKLPTSFDIETKQYDYTRIP